MNHYQILRMLIVCVCLLCTTFLCVGQIKVPCSQPDDCVKCKKQKKVIFQDNISKYLQGENKLDTAKANWKEVCFSNLDKYLPPMSKTANLISVKYDGVGCVYPLFMSTDLLGFETSFSKSRDKYLYKYSFYHMFYPDHLADQTKFLTRISESIPAVEQEFMTELSKKRLMHRRNIDDHGNIDSLRANDIFDFAYEWNQKYQSEIIDLINNTVRQKNIKKIVVFIPGFNVPYALEHLQANNIVDIYEKELNDSVKFEQILFLKIYWPSLSYKHDEMTASKFNIGNKLKLNTARSFNFVRNRAFNVGLHARTLLAKIEFAGSFDMIGHSTGSDIIGIILVDPTTKMNLQMNKNRTPYKLAMAKHFSETPLPNRTVYAFLNAPSIPGVATFNKDVLCRKEQTGYFWTIGYNKFDKVLQKLKGSHQSSNLANWGGNTSLGGDVNGAVSETIDELKKHPSGLGSNFRFVELGKQKDLFGHDFFCYLNQDCFKEEFGSYIRK